MEEEPIRRLSREEFEALRASIIASRKPAQTRLQANANKIAQAEMALHEEGMEIGLLVWEGRKAGRTKRAIAKELGISATVVDACLTEFETRMGMEAGRMADHYRMLDDERIEDLMAYWLPIAQHGRIRIEHVRDGEIYSEVDFDRPLKAAYWVLQAIGMRLKMMMAARPEGGTKAADTNVLVWLQNVLPGVSKVVREVEALNLENGEGEK
jgi:hypothetical protein